MNEKKKKKDRPNSVEGASATFRYTATLATACGVKDIARENASPRKSVPSYSSLRNSLPPLILSVSFFCSLNFYAFIDLKILNQIQIHSFRYVFTMFLNFLKLVIRIEISNY